MLVGVTRRSYQRAGLLLVVGETPQLARRDDTLLVIVVDDIRNRRGGKAAVSVWDGRSLYDFYATFCETAGHTGGNNISHFSILRFGVATRRSYQRAGLLLVVRGKALQRGC